MNSTKEREKIVNNFKMIAKSDPNILMLMLSGSTALNRENPNSDLDIRLIVKKIKEKNGVEYINTKSFENEVPVHVITMTKGHAQKSLKNNDFEAIEIMKYSKILISKDKEVNIIKEAAENYVVPKEIIKSYVDSSKALYVKTMSKLKKNDFESAEYTLRSGFELITNTYLLLNGIIDPKPQWAIHELKQLKNKAFYNTLINSTGIARANKKSIATELAGFGQLLLILQKQLEEIK